MESGYLQGCQLRRARGAPRLHAVQLPIFNVFLQKATNKEPVNKEGGIREKWHVLLCCSGYSVLASLSIPWAIMGPNVVTWGQGYPLPSAVIRRCAQFHSWWPWWIVLSQLLTSPSPLLANKPLVCFYHCLENSPQIQKDVAIRPCAVRRVGSGERRRVHA